MNRYDAATAKVTAVTAVEVAPLVADVLDELMDLYVMRLGQAEGGGDMADPPPVAPRVVVTCPSGIDGEVQARYAPRSVCSHGGSTGSSPALPPFPTLPCRCPRRSRRRATRPRCWRPSSPARWASRFT